MRVCIEVRDEAEAMAVRTAMADPETRALVMVVGTLLPTTKGTQRRIMTFIADHFAEKRETVGA